MARRIHTDKAAALHVGGDVLNLEPELRGIGRMVELDRHDVVVARHRPIRAIAAFGAVVDRRFAPQTREQRLPSVLLVDGWIGDVDSVERHTAAIFRVHRYVHESSPQCCALSTAPLHLMTANAIQLAEF
jgi:hypothetical protein